MQYGMIGYYVPHSVYPEGYHCNPQQPLPFACLASQKNHLSLYLMSAYGEGVGGRLAPQRMGQNRQETGYGKMLRPFQKTGGSRPRGDRPGDQAGDGARIHRKLRPVPAIAYAQKA